MSSAIMMPDPVLPNYEEIHAKPASKVPWRPVIFASALLIVGTAMLMVGFLNDPDRFWPLLLLGTLMVIPGSYYTYFAYKAFRGQPDWDFLEYPDC